MGPLLFILYSNNLITLPLSPPLKIILYADDTSPSSLSQFFNRTSIVYPFAYLPCIYPSTPKYMIITRKPGGFISTLPPLYLFNHPLQRVSSYKYLEFLLHLPCPGLLIYPQFALKHEKLSVPISVTFTMIPSPDVLLKLYKSLVLSHFLYCSSV